MGFFSNDAKNSAFPWKELISVNQWNDLWEQQVDEPIVVFKHSTRCSISAMALRFFEANQGLKQQNNLYMLDLLQHRAISNAIADQTGIEHQSPQVIVFQNKQILYHASHQSIDGEKVNELLNRK